MSSPCAAVARRRHGACITTGHAGPAGHTKSGGQRVCWCFCRARYGRYLSVTSNTRNSYVCFGIMYYVIQPCQPYARLLTSILGTAASQHSPPSTMDLPLPLPPSFTHLPAELRCKIFNLLLPSPRILPVRFSARSRCYYTPHDPDPLASAPPASAALALSAICAESRTIFLQHYELLVLHPSYTSRIYVDLERDTLLFEHESCSPDGDLPSNLARSPQRARIRNVAFYIELWEILRCFQPDSLAEVRHLPHLQDMMLVAIDGTGGRTGNWLIGHGRSAIQELHQAVTAAALVRESMLTEELGLWAEKAEPRVRTMLI